MATFEKINSPSTKRIIALIVFPFLITFAISRLIVYLVLGHWMPNLFLTVRGVHIHHFTYGVVILVINSLYLLLKHPKPDSHAFRYNAFAFGIGLGLTFDEFGMWIRLEDDYWVRQSYDAIVIILLLLLNIAYYRSIINFITKETRWFMRLYRHFKNKPANKKQLH
jgi:hypothetical protein